MGTKTLAEMREQIRRKLAATGEDPIAWLEKRIASGKRRGIRTDVLDSIKRVLQRPAPKKSRKSKTKAPA
jgi:hypothetical protein